jgi:hypothetical protein
MAYIWCSVRDYKVLVDTLHGDEMAHGTWNMEHGTWNMEHGTWNMESTSNHESRCPVTQKQNKTIHRSSNQTFSVSNQAGFRSLVLVVCDGYEVGSKEVKAETNKDGIA